jgi:hypothetical protein
MTDYEVWAMVETQLVSTNCGQTSDIVKDLISNRISNYRRSIAERGGEQPYIRFWVWYVQEGKWCGVAAIEGSSGYWGDFWLLPQGDGFVLIPIKYP